MWQPHSFCIQSPSSQCVVLGWDRIGFIIDILILGLLGMIILWVGSISIDHKLWLGLILPAETGAWDPMYLEVNNPSLFQLTHIYKLLMFCPIDKDILFRMEMLSCQVDGV